MHAWAAHSAWASASLLLFMCFAAKFCLWTLAGLWTQQLNCAPVSLPDHRLCMCITLPSPPTRSRCLQLSSQLEELRGADAVQQLLSQLDGEWQHLRRLRQKYGSSSSAAVAAAASVAIAPAATGVAAAGSHTVYQQVNAAHRIDSCNTGGQQVAA